MSNRRNTRDDFDIQSEHSLEKLVIIDKLTNIVESFLLPASYADPQGGLGFCLPLACSDVYNHRRRLFELTRKLGEAEYVDHIFGDSYSVNQLIAHDCPDIQSLLQCIASRGATTSYHYDAAPIHPSTGAKDLKGCRILRVGKCKGFEKDTSGQSEAEKEKTLSTWAEEIGKELFSFGPVVGAFYCRLDYERVAEDFLYQPDARLDWIYCGKGNTSVLAHAVMIVGLGLAKCKSTGILTSYFIFQNNWGNDRNSIGRMPIREFMNAYAPIIEGQTDLTEYFNDPNLEAKVEGRRCLLALRM